MTRPATSASSTALAACRAVRRLAPDTVRTCRGVVLGARAVLCFELHPQEAGRREQAGLGAVTDIDVLDLFLGLPLGAPVGRKALSGRERRALAKTPAGCVETAPATVTRRARPPLTVALAIVTAHSWRRGLEHAGRFAPFCTRAVLLDRPPRDLATACAEADFYGVGLLVTTGPDVEVLVPPEPHRPGRVAARNWWSAEEAYRAHLAGAVTPLRPAAESARA